MRALVGLSVAAACSALFALLLGGTRISAQDWLALGQLQPATEWLRFIVVHVRLPRVLVAFLVGSALGVSGAALQGLFRNPLADSSVLGVSAGAALLAQCSVFLGWAALWPLSVPLAASVGALLATLALMTLVGQAERGAIELLVLGGVALGQVAAAVSALLISVAIADFSTAQRMLQWLLGSLDGRTWMHVFWGLGPVLAGSAWLVYRARELDAMTLGDVTALSLGVDVPSIRRDIVLATALLSGSAVAMGGIVGFVGLLVPHAMRRLVGPGHALLLPASALGGGCLVIGADVLCRTLIAPQELQLGVVTAALGAPCFLLLLRRRLRWALS